MKTYTLIFISLNITSKYFLFQLAAVAALCVQYEAEFRPNMTIVVKALSPLLVQKPAAPVPDAATEATGAAPDGSS
jgi:hypothetical protein